MSSPVAHKAVPLVAALAVGLLFSGCSTTKPAPQPQVEQTVATPTPTPEPEETVTKPVNEPVPSVEVKEELPQDIKELNRRGYLKDVFFDTDSYELKPEAKTKLAENASWLQKHPTIKILIEGHCDERNTREYNLALGERRANAVRDYLIFLGVPADRIATISYGEERPFALGHNEAAWRLNRRAHFVITAR
ncbi:MAG TPA: peptidoglycan-associated lipoprotein Pal [Acidobacteria bacterium]|nr:peptidoglycan-associated lipoprotein Pal [Acidobacteriota bacterium]